MQTEINYGIRPMAAQMVIGVTQSSRPQMEAILSQVVQFLMVLDAGMSG